MATPNVQRGFICTAERHLWRSGLALAIYSKISALSWNSATKEHGRYFTSVEMMSEYLGADYSATYKAFQLLKQKGWLEKELGKNPFKSKDYKIITHEARRLFYPDECFAREGMVWDDEESKDRLGVLLFKTSFGRMKLYANHLAALRSTGLADDAIILACASFIEQLSPRPADKKGWKRAMYQFINSVKKLKPESPLGLQTQQR